MTVRVTGGFKLTSPMIIGMEAEIGIIPGISGSPTYQPDVTTVSSLNSVLYPFATSAFTGTTGFNSNETTASLWRTYDSTVTIDGITFWTHTAGGNSPTIRIYTSEYNNISGLLADSGTSGSGYDIQIATSFTYNANQPTTYNEVDITISPNSLFMIAFDGGPYYTSMSYNNSGEDLHSVWTLNGQNTIAHIGRGIYNTHNNTSIWKFPPEVGGGSTETAFSSSQCPYIMPHISSVT